jgi:hypothetical protein
MAPATACSSASKEWSRSERLNAQVRASLARLGPQWDRRRFDCRVHPGRRTPFKSPGGGERVVSLSIWWEVSVESPPWEQGRDPRQDPGPIQGNTPDNYGPPSTPPPNFGPPAPPPYGSPPPPNFGPPAPPPYGPLPAQPPYGPPPYGPSPQFIAPRRNIRGLVVALVIAVTAAVVAVIVYSATAHSDNYNQCIAMTKQESHNAGQDWNKQTWEHYCTEINGR